MYMYTYLLKTIVCIALFCFEKAAVNKDTYIHIYIHTYTHSHTYIHIYIYTYIHTYMHILLIN